MSRVDLRRPDDRTYGVVTEAPKANDGLVRCRPSVDASNGSQSIVDFHSDVPLCMM